VEDQDPHERGIVPVSAGTMVISLFVPRPQLYRLRSRNDREVIREVEPGAVYVDRETGEEFTVVGKVLPLAPSESRLPWSVENLRMCGCSLEQLAPKDVPDCPTCGRRLPAIEG
jgi:hypothetical protein